MSISIPYRSKSPSISQRDSELRSTSIKRNSINPNVVNVVRLSIHNGSSPRQSLQNRPSLQNQNRPSDLDKTNTQPRNSLSQPRPSSFTKVNNFETNQNQTNTYPYSKDNNNKNNTNIFFTDIDQDQDNMYMLNQHKYVVNDTVEILKKKIRDLELKNEKLNEKNKFLESKTSNNENTVKILYNNEKIEKLKETNIPSDKLRKRYMFHKKITELEKKIIKNPNFTFNRLIKINNSHTLNIRENFSDLAKIKIEKDKILENE